MLLSDILVDLREKEVALQSEVSTLMGRMAELKALSKTHETLQEKLMSLGIAINRIEMLIEADKPTEEIVWGE